MLSQWNRKGLRKFDQEEGRTSRNRVVEASRKEKLTAMPYKMVSSSEEISLGKIVPNKPTKRKTSEGRGEEGIICEIRAGREMFSTSRMPENWRSSHERDANLSRARNLQEPTLSLDSPGQDHY